MEFVDLRTGYLLTGFDDFESAYTATEKFCEKGFRVAYLNEASHVREPEVRSFTRCFNDQDEKKYQNYHYILRDEAKTKAVESMKTAIEVLEQKISHKSKFIMVVDTKK